MIKIVYPLTVINNAIISGRYRSFKSEDEMLGIFTIEKEYDSIIRDESNDLLVFTDSRRGTNPFSGTESLIDKIDQNTVWICDYVGYILNDPIVDIAEILGFMKLGKEKYLDSCIDSIKADIDFGDSGYTYSMRSIGDFSSMLQLEKVIYMGQVFYSTTYNCMYFS